MTSDLIALARRRPDVHAVADGLVALEESLELRGGEPEATRLHDADGRLLVAIGDPVLVSVPGEVGRLLGAEFGSRTAAPVWWVDVRAVGDLPEAVRVARRFADALVRWAGGTVYPDGAPEPVARSWKAADQGEPASLSDGPEFQGGVIGGGARGGS